ATTLFGSGKQDSNIGNTYLNLGVVFKFGAAKQVAAAGAETAMADIAPAEEEALPPLSEPAMEQAPAFDKITLKAEVLFDFDSSVLKPTGKKILDAEVLDKMKAHPEVELVLITGHADRIGDEPYNQRLSERRAEAVKKHLMSQGITEGRLHTVGKGEKEPVVDCKGVRGKKLIECLQPNRRVVVEVEAQTPPQK
ncbi:MAG: OmpA family protein, partial [Nitrosomonadales bacterium]